MDSNKDEALRCLVIAKEAIAAGNKQKALKFLGIARRLNHDLSVDDLFSACEDLKSPSSSHSQNENKINGVRNDVGKVDEVRNGERAYSEENVQLIRQIKSKKDYYSILGVEKTCSGEEIRKAYRKWSLKVHPDKNKAPGSEEAFKKVSKAFKCLSDDDSRRQYDQTGLVDDFEYNQQHNVRRRRRTGNGFYADEFDADEIFRAFFGQNDMFRSSHVYHRTRAAGGQQREGVAGNGPNFMILLQLLPFVLVMLLAYLPFSEPEYSLQRNYTYQVMKTTEMYGVEYYVKSDDFDQRYPHTSPGRESLEQNVIRDYKNTLGRYCHIELQRRQWNRHYPTPHCDRLHEFGSLEVW